MINLEIIKSKQVSIGERQYLSVKDFASAVYRSYPLIYRLMKYGPTGREDEKLEHIYWNEKPMIPVSEVEKFKNRRPAGRPRKVVVE